MAMTAEQIEKFIKEAIPDATVEIVDLKGDGDHYSATVRSKTFSGKTFSRASLDFHFFLSSKFFILKTFLQKLFCTNTHFLEEIVSFWTFFVFKKVSFGETFFNEKLFYLLTFEKVFISLIFQNNDFFLKNIF